MRITLTRQELYARVWSEPVQKLSQELGISDRGLAKLCARHDIPVPARGYWAKKAAGKPARQVPLPEASNRAGNRIDFAGPSNPPSAQADAPVHPLIAAESDPVNAITVSERQRVRHPLLTLLREHWRYVRQPYWDRGTAPPRVEVNVDRAQQPRALRLLQALFSALEARSHGLTRGDDGRLVVTVLGERCFLTLRERQRQTRTASEPAAATNTYTPRVQLVGTGDLELRVERQFGRRAVADGKHGRLEDRLNEVVVTLLEFALAEKADRAAREAARRVEEERQRRIEEARERARHERARVAHLERLAEAADRHQRLRHFAAALRDAAGPAPDDSALGRWLAWVDQHVADSDVLGKYRARSEKLRLYFLASSYDASEILSRGFVDEKAEYGDDQELPAAVQLTDVPLERLYGESVAIMVTLPEGEALPFERLGGRHGYRTFRVPASVANQFPRAVRD